MKTKSMAILATAAIGLTQYSNAHVTHYGWSDNRVTMRVRNASFPSTAFIDALNTVRDRFYSNPSEMWFELSYNDTSVGLDNDQNEVWMTNNPDVNPAMTFWWYGAWPFWDEETVEADIAFFNGVAWTPTMTKTALTSYDGGLRPFQTTAIHEFGHAAGLDHEDDEYNIMGEDWTHLHCNGTVARSYIGEDACAGLLSLYGRYSGGAIEDVSVSVFKYLGSDGEYSTHRFCDVLTGAALSQASHFEGQPRYTVNRGQLYRVEFTFENNGETDQTCEVRYYLSTNSTISRSDTPLTPAGRRMTFHRDGAVSTREALILIPSDLAAGTYYLGVIVDDTNILAEVDEDNAAYHIIRIP